MENKFGLALGYPIGQYDLGNGMMFYIQFGKEEPVGLNAFQTVIWSLCSKVQSVDFVSSQIKSIFEQQIDIEPMLQNLIDHQLLVIFDLDDSVDVFNKIKDVKVCRQGFGMGIENDKGFVRLGEKLIEISSDELDTWINLGRSETVNELANNVANYLDLPLEEVLNFVIKNVFSLLNNELILFNGGN